MDETRNPQQPADPPSPESIPPDPAGPEQPAAQAPESGGHYRAAPSAPAAEPPSSSPNPFAYPRPGEAAYQPTEQQPAAPTPTGDAAFQRPSGATYGETPLSAGTPFASGPTPPASGAPHSSPYAGPPQASYAGPGGPSTGTTTAIPLPPGYPAAPAQPRQRGRGRLVAGITVGAIALALASGVTGAVTTLAVSDESSDSAPIITRDVSPASTKSQTAGTVEAAAAIIKPSVVTLQVVGSSGGRTSQGTGSGVVIRTDGHILTNNHVVAPAADGGTVRVFFSDGTSKQARIVGRDPSNDLAVVKVDGVDNLKAATFADSASVKIGQPVLAVGAPLGLSGTVTEGIISAVNRPVRTGDGTGQDAVIDAVQTDAAINPGNSGGPLVDLSGRVIGINSAIATVGGGDNGLPGQSPQSGNIGVGFAIPADDAVRIAQQLIADGTATHATLGVSAQDAADGAGATVASVVPGSPADKAGLRAQDVVTAIGDRRVIDVDSLVAAVRDHQPGDKVTVHYQRGGKAAKVEATLTSS